MPKSLAPLPPPKHGLDLPTFNNVSYYVEKKRHSVETSIVSNFWWFTITTLKLHRLQAFKSDLGTYPAGIYFFKLTMEIPEQCVKSVQS